MAVISEFKPIKWKDEGIFLNYFILIIRKIQDKNMVGKKQAKNETNTIEMTHQARFKFFST